MGRVIAVGDRNQAIYGFRGAHTGSMDELKERFGMVELPLNTSYRCPRAIVKKAQSWVPQIESHESAAEGYVGEEGTDWKGMIESASGVVTGESLCHCGVQLDRHNPMEDGHSFVAAPVEPWPDDISQWQALAGFRAGDVVLCRLTRPLVALAFALIRARVPARVLGRDIGRGLVDLVTRVSKRHHVATSEGLATFDRALGDYQAHESDRMRQKGKKCEIGRLEDQVATIRVFIDSMVREETIGNVGVAGGDSAMGSLQESTVADLISEIERLFTDNGQGVVILSTVHKSKGLEWDRVFVLDARELMPWRWAVQPWELQQEQNIQYVAATRSRRELRYITSEELGVKT